MIKFKIDPKCEPETKVFMKAVTAKLDGVSEPCDLGSLNMLMVSYNVYIQAGKALLNEGSLVKDRMGKASPHPAIALQRAYWSQVVTLMKEIGLTIRSRERIRSLTPPADPDNALVQFLQK